MFSVNWICFSYIFLLLTCLYFLFISLTLSTLLSSLFNTFFSILFFFIYSNMIRATTEQKEERIKRPMNAFMVFSHQARKMIAKKNPNLKNSDLSKFLGSTWKWVYIFFYCTDVAVFVCFFLSLIMTIICFVIVIVTRIGNYLFKEFSQ